MTMALPTPLRLKGAPGSPYTRKMLAYMRYRHIPYEFLAGDQLDKLDLPRPKVELLPTFYLPDENGKIQAAGEYGWVNSGDARGHLFELLCEMGRAYAPTLIANACAIQNGDKQMQTTVGGKSWEQPVFPYQAKCLQWVREEFAALSSEDQAGVREILADTGCEALLEQA